MEVEPRVAKQYKCHHCCSCKNYQGKGMEGGKKVSLCHFLADQKTVSLWKNCVLGHPMAYSASNNCCKTLSDYGPPNMSLKLAV